MATKEAVIKHLIEEVLGFDLTGTPAADLDKCIGWKGTDGDDDTWDIGDFVESLNDRDY